MRFRASVFQLLHPIDLGKTHQSFRGGNPPVTRAVLKRYLIVAPKRTVLQILRDRKARGDEPVVRKSIDHQSFLRNCEELTCLILKYRSHTVGSVERTVLQSVRFAKRREPIPCNLYCAIVTAQPEVAFAVLSHALKVIAAYPLLFLVSPESLSVEFKQPAAKRSLIIRFCDDPKMPLRRLMDIYNSSDYRCIRGRVVIDQSFVLANL